MSIIAGFIVLSQVTNLQKGNFPSFLIEIKGQSHISLMKDGEVIEVAQMMHCTYLKFSSMVP